MTVNYIIACWMGPRRNDDSRAVGDRAFYLKTHLWALEAAQRSLDHVTIVLAEGGDADADAFTKAVKKVGSVPVTVLVRENLGYSYGSWNHAFDVFGDDFNHHIIVEDDYAPWVVGFDDHLVAHAKEKKTYVCGAASRVGKHAAISNGIIPRDVWKAVHPAPCVAGSSVRDGNQSQRIWTAAFASKGYPIQDYMGTHSSPFWVGGSVRWYGDFRKDPMFMPCHAARSTVLISDRRRQTVRMKAEKVGSWEVYEEDRALWGKMNEVMMGVPG